MILQKSEGNRGVTKKIKQQGFSRVCSHGCHLVILQEADVLRCYQWRGRVALPLSHVAVQGSWQGRTCSYSSWLPPWWLKQANRCSWRLILQKRCWQFIATIRPCRAVSLSSVCPCISPSKELLTPGMLRFLFFLSCLLSPII